MLSSNLLHNRLISLSSKHGIQASLKEKTIYSLLEEEKFVCGKLDLLLSEEQMIILCRRE